MSCVLLRKYIVLTALALGIGCGTSSHDVTDLYRKTCAAYEARLAQTPQDETLRKEFAGFCYEFREYDKVKEILKTPETTEEKIILAKALAKNKEFTHALEIFNQVRNEIKGPEGLFLYGQVLEEQNLYPQAVKIYEKVGGSFKEKALQRLSRIKAQTGKETPEYINALLKEAAPRKKKPRSPIVIPRFRRSM
jgi:tetratricopeptide (TPR) repeat protein